MNEITTTDEPRQSQRRDRGVGLIEVLVAVLILGIGVVATVVALQAAVTASSVDQNDARAKAWLQAGSDRVAIAPYAACGAAQGAYQTAVEEAARPTQWSAEAITVAVDFLSRSGGSESWGATCAADVTPSPLFTQRVIITVTDPDGGTHEIEMIRGK